MDFNLEINTDTLTAFILEFLQPNVSLNLVKKVSDYWFVIKFQNEGEYRLVKLIPTEFGDWFANVSDVYSNTPLRHEEIELSDPWLWLENFIKDGIFPQSTGNLKIDSEIEHNPQAFTSGRYAIHLDGYINLEHIDQLNHELGAINPLLTRSVKGSIYLTADKFKNLSFLIEKARVLDKVDKYKDCELIHINHWLFSEVSYYF